MMSLFLHEGNVSIESNTRKHGRTNERFDDVRINPSLELLSYRGISLDSLDCDLFPSEFQVVRKEDFWKQKSMPQHPNEDEIVEHATWPDERPSGVEIIGRHLDAVLAVVTETTKQPCIDWDTTVEAQISHEPGEVSSPPSVDSSLEGVDVATISPSEQGSKVASSRQKASDNKKPLPPVLCSELPEDFVPSPWSVIVGRDKASLESPGTRRLHVVTSWYLERYAKCGSDRAKKTKIIKEIERTIRRGNAGQAGAFVKFEDGKWCEVSTNTVREKIGRILRESLHTMYSSCSRRKRARRRLAKIASIQLNDTT